MGVGGIKGPLRVAAKILALLLALLLAGLLALRLAAALREGPVPEPSGMVKFGTPGGAVAASVAGPPGGPRVMLVHGSAGWSGFWKDVTAHLAAQGWRVIAVDLPPFGWSDRDPLGRYDRITQAERLAAVIAATGHPAVVVGHSFGAGPATELALRHPERVRALVLVDAALGELDQTADGAAVATLGLRPVAEVATSATITNPLALRLLLRPMLARKDSADSWLEVLKAPMRREGTTAAYAAWLPSLMARSDGARSRRSSELREIRVPVALIWGAADPVTPLEQGRRIAALTRARSLTVLPGVGHIPHIEDPEHFNVALDAALLHTKGTQGCAAASC